MSYYSIFGYSNPKTAAFQIENNSVDNWLANDPAKLTVTGGESIHAIVGNASNDAASLDFGLLSDDHWVCQFKMSIGGGTGHVVIAMCDSDSGEGSNTSQDCIGMHYNPSTSSWLNCETDGEAPFSHGLNGVSAGIDNPSYVTMERQSDVLFKITVYDDEARTQIHADITQRSVPNTVINLRYFKVMNREAVVGSNTNYTLDDITVYNDPL